MQMMEMIKRIILLAILLCFSISVYGDTDPADFTILQKFLKGLDNPELLKWPSGSEDPCGEKWPHVFCSGNRVSQIQVQKLGLSGTLPPDLNKLTELENVGLQNNNFSGPLPSFSGLSKLQKLFLDNNRFDSISSDSFVGLTSLQIISLSNNPLNESTGWAFPTDLQGSSQLTLLSLMQCNLMGQIPDFIGTMASLTSLQLSYNNLTGVIPPSFNGSGIQTLWLNNQQGPGLSGTLDMIGTMPSLTQAWLHGNSFGGTIPRSFGGLSSLTELWLNNNQLVGLVPDSLGKLPQLRILKLDSNKLMGPVPEVGGANVSYSGNSFCQDKPGIPCSSEVMALIDFLGSIEYPLDLPGSWSGNDPCNNWIGVSCLSNKVSVINLPGRNLNGTLGPSIAELGGLVTVKLGNNNLEGKIPQNLTSLKSLKMLDLSSNNIGPPVPQFSSGVTVLTQGNPLLDPLAPKRPPPSNSPPSDVIPSPPGNSPTSPSAPEDAPTSPSVPSAGKSGSNESKKGGSKKFIMWIVIGTIAILGIMLLILSYVIYTRLKGKKGTFPAPSSVVVHPRDSSDPDNVVKVAVANNASNSMAASDLLSNYSGATGHAIESGNLIVSVQILREVTNNFNSENELGRGGFGVVYKGELYDGAMIAVKRMEAAVISSKALDEFQSEIAVLSKVRHRNLVALLGFSVEGNERLLVYEYMPQGALSMHLFYWKQLKLEPLSWKKRLNIALDVARGMEYLHNLTQHCFIHRDLKSSNILLDDDYRAKVSDFGLVKLAPYGKDSVVTRLAGTFGYLAPEYAVTGKVTTKADVFSYGVVLMELITGLKALDEERLEEKRYLASWFCSIKSNKETLRDAIDKSLEVTDDTFESICIICELAGHCAAREPYQRPDMGHAVNVLAPLVEKWRPASDDEDEYLGIDLGQPLLQMVKGWQDADIKTTGTSTSHDDSKGSIPARPAGFAESFTSADGR